MKLLRLVWLVTCLAWIVNAGADPATPAQDTEILVTFADRSLLRTEFGQPGQHYAPSADYTSSGWSRGISRELAREYSLITATEWPIRELGMHCVVYRVPAERDVVALIASLNADARVASVQRMNTFQVMSGDPYRALQGNLNSLSLAEAHRWSLGRNVTVAVVDTGIDAGHPDLRGRVSATQELVGNFDGPPATTVPADIHGTAVAGVIAASAGNGEGIVGVAPGANVIGLRACWPLARDKAAAECNSLTLARALSAVLQLRPQVLNLSLSGPHDPLLSALLKLVIGKGTIVVAAEPPASVAGAGFPADVAQVIRVNPAGAPRARGPALVGAPGTQVLTTYPNASYSFVNGSSFAAAHVSGIVALLKELQPALTSEEVSRVLQESAIGAGGAQSRQLGSVSACAAVAQVSRNAECAPVVSGDATTREPGSARTGTAPDVLAGSVAPRGA